MRIIKKGKEKDEAIIFTCRNCGCEFECLDDEYWQGSSLCNITYPPSYTIYSNCPECHKICKAFKRDKIKSMNITLTSATVDGDSFV